MDNYETQRQFLEHYKYAHDFWGPFAQNAEKFVRAKAGKTWTRHEEEALIKDGREPIEFNIMRRPLEFYSGYLRDNLNSLVIAPAGGSDQETADQLDEVNRLIWEKGGGYDTFLDACDENFAAGISLCGITMDYSQDFVHGDIDFYMRTYNSFYLDPTFSDLDLSDCGFAILRDLINKESAKSLLSGIIDEKEIDEIERTHKDDKFMSYHPQSMLFNQNKKVLAYDQYYTRQTRSRKMLVDLDSGFFSDISDESKENIDRLEMGLYRFEKLRQEGEEVPRMEIRNVQRPYVPLCVMLNGEKVYEGDDTTGIVEQYPFVPLVCYFERSVWSPSLRIQGIPATLFSNQRQFNKRHMKIIDIMDRHVSSGFKYLLGSVPDPEELQQTGQNKLIGVTPDENPYGLDAVQELQGAPTNPALFEYQKILDDLSLTLSNINESVLGVDEGGNTQVSGRLAQVRIAQGLRSNRKVMDNIEKSQQLLGSLVLKAIQNNYPPQKIERMIEKTPTPEFYEKSFDKYDAVVKEGIRSKTQKDAYYYELVNLVREGIVDVPQAEIVRALQMAGLSDLQKAIEQQQEQAQEQQAKIDEQERVALELANSQIVSNLSLAKERQARVQADIGLAEERISESEQNRAQAALDRAKTITEIANMSTDRVLRVMEFVNLLEQQEIADRENVREDVKNEHAKIDSMVELNQQIKGGAE